ncbi:YdjY domain-containing protein [Prosthecobacter sp. SYSU 5D2]|uniref:YdjY domain-containing protein n=1 Tax=Prosthecobacter sp. SYSU 5D2 TaxID=3134134 RepID=UPI0031FED3F9
MLRPFATLLLLCVSLVELHAQEEKVDGTQQLAAAQQRLKKLSATEYDLDGIRINAATREVRIPTQVELKQAPLEYMLVHETGKTHESVLTTAVSPTAVQVALLLANYQAATEGLLTKVPEEERPKIWKEEPPAKPGANRVKIEVEWKVGEETKKTPLSQWVQNSDTRKPPPDLETWVFNGSYMDERGFIGEHEGSIIAVWLDRGALMNSPAEGAWDDSLWISLPANIPDEGTPVTVIITPAQP